LIFENVNLDLPSRQGKNAPYTESLYKFQGDLDWRAIHALFDHQDFNPSHKWIAGQIGCSVEKVVEAIEGLITLGIIKRTTDGFAIAKKDFSFSDLGEINRESRIDSNILLTQQISQKRNYVSPGFDRTSFVSSNKELTTELFEKISELITDYRKKSLESHKDGVYSLAVIATDILSGEKA
jgi:DNA-binding Lrp family transcriptional regulator